MEVRVRTTSEDPRGEAACPWLIASFSNLPSQDPLLYLAVFQISLGLSPTRTIVIGVRQSAHPVPSAKEGLISRFLANYSRKVSF